MSREFKMDKPLATFDFDAKCVRIYKEVAQLVIASIEAGDVPIVRAQLNLNAKRGEEMQLMFKGSYHLEDFKKPEEERKLWTTYIQAIFDPQVFLQLCGWLREQKSRGIIATRTIETHEARAWRWEFV